MMKNQYKSKQAKIILQVRDRHMCENSYLTYEHSIITQNQAVLDKKLDTIMLMLQEHL